MTPKQFVDHFGKPFALDIIKHRKDSATHWDRTGYWFFKKYYMSDTIKDIYFINDEGDYENRVPNGDNLVDLDDLEKYIG